jgi:hypothetical protein
MQADRKAQLTMAFEALGPERVARGLEAHGHSWSDCFLAVALGGEPGTLARQLQGRWRRERVVGDILGVRVHVVSEVVTAWDHDEATFRALAAEWLEANRVPAAPTPVESSAEIAATT